MTCVILDTDLSLFDLDLNERQSDSAWKVPSSLCVPTYSVFIKMLQT